MHTKKRQGKGKCLDMHSILGLDDENLQREILRLRELGTQEAPLQRYIYPLSQNSSMPPLGGSYVAKLERSSRRG